MLSDIYASAVFFIRQPCAEFPQNLCESMSTATFVELTDRDCQRLSSCVLQDDLADYDGMIVFLLF